MVRHADTEMSVINEINLQFPRNKVMELHTGGHMEKHQGQSIGRGNKGKMWQQHLCWFLWEGIGEAG